MIARDAPTTENYGRKLAKTLEPGTIVALHGDLGAGKTTLVKGIVSDLMNIPSQHVSSPTFTLMHLYEAEPTPIYHFDLYRLKTAQEFISLGFTDYLTADGICLIEWPDKIASLLPASTIHIHLSHLEEGGRRIDV